VFVTLLFAPGSPFEPGPPRDTSLNDKLRLTDGEIAILLPLCLPMPDKSLAIATVRPNSPPLSGTAARSPAHLPGGFIPTAGGNHFKIVNEPRGLDNLLTRQMPLPPN